MHYAYVIRSLKDNKLYVGHTNDLKRRFKEHNSGMVLSTKKRILFELLYYEACNVVDDAVKREKELKTGFGRAYLKRRLQDLESPLPQRSRCSMARPHRYARRTRRAQHGETAKRCGRGLSSFDSVLFQNRQADVGNHRKKSPHMISANITQKVKAAFASAFAPSFASVLA
jgi:putative endonuclease